MYENIGKKIQMFAVINAACITIAGILAWIIMLFNDRQADNVLAWVCLVIAIGALSASWPLYGFGQLVEDVHELRVNSKVSIPQNDTLPDL